MGYLTQNKDFNNYTLRINIRIRSTWIVRNSVLIYFILSSFASAPNFSLTSTKDIFILLKISKYVFGRFPHFVFLSSKYLRQTTFGLNFPKSAHYKGCRQICAMFDQNSVEIVRHVRIHYLYHSVISIVTTPRLRKFFKCLLYQIFTYWLNVWVVLSNSLILPHSFVCAPGWWKFITYTNVFYLKVYNT